MPTPLGLSRALGSLLVLSLPATVGCLPGDLLGQGGDSGSSTYSPDTSAVAPPHRAALACGDADSTHLCVALKYVSFQDASAQAITPKSAASDNLAGINSTWAQCHIAFTIEQYSTVDAAAQGLPSQPSSDDDLAKIRGQLADDHTLLVATTQQWTGNLGSEPANAWTVLPPTGPFGSVLEASVSAYPNLIAHELGHYLNLEHTADVYNVMNPVVYGNSINLVESQCAMARATAISFWGNMLR